MALGGLLACGGITDLPDRLAPRSGPLAIVNVAVLSVADGAVHYGRTVLTSGDRIVALGPADEVTVPDDAFVVDGRGKFLSPGLVDMHVHLREAHLDEYLRFGVTSVRNMWGTPAVRGLIESIERGNVLGPSIVSTSPGLDEEPIHWPGTRLVAGSQDAAAAVAEQEAAGWYAVKIYQDLSLPVYEAIAEAAAVRGIRIEGHAPHKVGLAGVLASGQRSIEHMGGIDQHVTTLGGRGVGAWRDTDPEKVREAAHAVAEAGVWVCPTLGVYRIFMTRFGAVDQVAIVENQRFALAELDRAGVGLLVGTDSGIDVTVPGRSLHEEMAEWVAAGLLPLRVLQAATTDAARFLGQEDEFGRVEAGLRADLLLSNENPLDLLQTLSRPVGVVVRGTWIGLRSGS